MLTEDDVRAVLADFADLAPNRCRALDFINDVDSPDDDENRPADLVALFTDGDPVSSARDRADRRRRRTTVAVAALAAGAALLTAAASAGLPVLPASVIQRMGWTPVKGAYNANPATARLLLTTAGPGGQALQLWYTEANDNGDCVDLIAVPIGSTGSARSNPATGVSAPPKTGMVVAGGCSGKNERLFGDEASLSGGGNPPGPTFFSMRVPGATSVRVCFRDGTRTGALTLAHGWTAGYLTVAQAARAPVLVGYDHNGRVVGRVPLKI